MIAEKRKQIREMIEQLPEPFLDHILSYLTELKALKEDENSDEFVVKLNDKYHKLLDQPAT